MTGGYEFVSATFGGGNFSAHVQVVDVVFASATGSGGGAVWNVCGYGQIVEVDVIVRRLASGSNFPRTQEALTAPGEGGQVDGQIMLLVVQFAAMALQIVSVTGVLGHPLNLVSTVGLCCHPRTATL